MERIGILKGTLLSGYGDEIKGENSIKITQSSPDETLKSSKSNIPQNLSAPPILEEIERLKIIRKKYQSLEDTERCMMEWKSKGNLELP